VAATVLVAYLIGALGDTIVAIPALRAIRERWPDSTLILLFNDDNDGRVTARDVLEDVGLIDEFLAYDSTKGLLERLRIIRHLRRQRVDVAIYLAPGLRSARAVLRDRWFFRATGASRLVGFTSVSEGKRNGVHESRVRLERLHAGGVSTSACVCTIPLIQPNPAALATVSRWLDSQRRDPTRPLIAFSPGSQMASKRWPLDRFAELGQRVLANFAVDTVIVGGSLEESMGEALTAQWGAGINAAGRFTVAETTALLSMTHLLITLDTGPMHVAAALGRECVALFSGIDSVGKWDPMGTGHVIIRHSVPCAGCRQTVCSVPGHPCMTNISVDDVWEAVAAKMSSLGAAHPGLVQVLP
jgi:ADP-heptose:LPS heptosyltransferase